MRVNNSERRIARAEDDQSHDNSRYCLIVPFESVKHLPNLRNDMAMKVMIPYLVILYSVGFEKAETRD